MNYNHLGDTNISISAFSLGTMTFGEQVNEHDSCEIMSIAYEQGINFFDTAEMYSAPTKKETFGLSEVILGKWLQTVDRSKVVIASKTAGPGRYPWIREGSGLTKQDIINSCNGSLQRLNTDYIDLYYIHWPERYTPMFGEIYYDHSKKRSSTSIEEQLEAMEILKQCGKIRHVGLSNETPYGVSEFMKYGKIAAVQNPYSLTNRSYENGLDEILLNNDISMIAYSPLGFGMLTGKYDSGFNDVDGRLSRYPDMQTRRWCRPDALIASKEYNQLAKSVGVDPAVFALAYCYQKKSIASTLLGVTSKEQLRSLMSSADVLINNDVLKRINDIRWRLRDPSQ